MEKINDYNIYTKSMRKSLLDKAFFMDKVSSDTFIDFGCADGSLLKFLHNMFPEYTYIGYDMDQEMIDRCNKPPTNALDRIRFTTDISEFLKDESLNPKTLILSSVIHEVYSYGTLESIDAFWNFVFNSNFDSIVIRDMIPSTTINRPSDINDVYKLKNYGNSNHISEFETQTGLVTNNKNMTHFLLKSFYKENWKREVRENYFSLMYEDLMKLIPNYYTVSYHETFIHTHMREKILREYQIDIKDHTHLKLILKRET